MQFRVLITAVLFASASAAYAAAADGSAPSSGNRVLDQNGVGMISREEAAAHPRLAQSFDRLDANQDGALSREIIMVSKARLSSSTLPAPRE